MQTFKMFLHEEQSPTPTKFLGLPSAMQMRYIAAGAAALLRSGRYETMFNGDGGELAGVLVVVINTLVTGDLSPWWSNTDPGKRLLDQMRRTLQKHGTSVKNLTVQGYAGTAAERDVQRAKLRQKAIVILDTIAVNRLSGTAQFENMTDAQLAKVLVAKIEATVK